MSNIYIVKDEEHLGEILNNNLYKLVLTIFTSKVNDVNFILKKWIISTANQFKNSIFLYIDVDNFKTFGLLEQKKCPINVLATTMIFFREQPLYIIRGNDVQAIDQCLKDAVLRTQQITNHVLKYGVPPENPTKTPKSPEQQIKPTNPPEQQTNPPDQQTNPQITLEMVQQMIQQTLSQLLPQHLQQLQMQLQSQFISQIRENKLDKPIENKKPDILNIINKLEAVKKTKQTEEELLKNT